MSKSRGPHGTEVERWGHCLDCGDPIAADGSGEGPYCAGCTASGGSP
jgi:hypothetical protein